MSNARHEKVSEKRSETRGKAQWLSRRRVLQLSAGTAALGSAAFAGVIAVDQVLPAMAGETLHQMRDHRVKLPDGTPSLVIARGTDPTRNVDAALARLGGLARFVTRNDVVLIKPNVGWDRTPAQAANTDPAVLEAVVRACKQAGARELWVIDGSVHDPARSFQRSGLREAALRGGARVILPDETTYVDCSVPGLPGRWPVLEPFVKADKIINVPVAKHHGSARVTAGMKNWFGITRQRRSLFHAQLDHAIASLAAMMRPTLTIVDATRILLRNGPKGGDLGDVKQEDALAVSLDPVAVDAWAAELLGANPASLGYLREAEQLGLGTRDFRSLQPVEIRI